MGVSTSWPCRMAAGALSARPVTTVALRPGGRLSPDGGVALTADNLPDGGHGGFGLQLCMRRF